MFPNPLSSSVVVTPFDIVIAVGFVPSVCTKLVSPAAVKTSALSISILKSPRI